VIVAYDLRYACDHFPGIGTHAWHLLQGLLAAEGDERYAVLWNPALPHRRFAVETLRTHPRVEWHESAIRPLHVLEILQVGAWLRARKPALYFSPFSLQPWRPQVPTVLTLHDVLPLTEPSLFGLPQRLAFRIAMRRARAASAVVTSSEFARGEIVRTTAIRPERVHLIRPGAPQSAGVGSPARPGIIGPYALVVGINRPHKNLETLAAAWARFGPEPPLSLVSVGPKDSRFPDLEALGRQHGAAGIHVRGRVSEAELESFYAHATMVLFPSRHEGFGFPLVEAFVRGVPAIAADIPSLREIGAGAARLVPTEDAAAWFAAVRDLAADEAARHSLAAAARERGRELSYGDCAARMLGLFRDCARK
jgi:glycosyltransferase involved in cell wall biosynthesis